MSDDYTPTTDELREWIRRRNWSPANVGMFDRWLAEHDREVAAKAQAAVIDWAEGKWLGTHGPYYTRLQFGLPQPGHEAAGKRIGTDCAHLHNGHPYACPRCDWTSSSGSGS